MATLRAALIEKLSDGASVFASDDSEFPKLAARWREWHAPGITTIVKPATEADVQQTIRYANEHDIPFVARSGGHGATEAYTEAKGAIQIDFRHMNRVEVSADGKTARIGGGANMKQIVESLAKVGKQTVTGICESVGISAVVLGGGHGWLQGQYGLPADQVLSARLVLPDGEAVTVSETSHPDLFWAIRGAGHNFGLVTEWEFRVYDIKNPKWSYEIFSFSGDKVEALFELTNDMKKTQPPEVTHWTYIVRIPEIDPDHPILWYAIIYDGPVAAAREYAKPIHGIGPLTVQAGEADIHGIAKVTLQTEDGAGCAYGLTSLRYPIGLKSYNIPALRKVYDDFDSMCRDVPELAGSLFLLEGYSTQGVQAIDPRTTAFPHRDDEILITSCLQYKPGNPAIDSVGQEYGRRMRAHLLEASDDPDRLRAYVNYAHGNESLREVYGWEDWRQEKLRSLKRRWDPENRMKFYVPIS